MTIWFSFNSCNRPFLWLSCACRLLKVEHDSDLIQISTICHRNFTDAEPAHFTHEYSNVVASHEWNFCLQWAIFSWRVYVTVDGDWSTWSSWSACSRDCRRYRRRACDNPPPANNGRHCVGNDVDTDNCTSGMPGGATCTRGKFTEAGLTDIRDWFLKDI